MSKLHSLQVRRGRGLPMPLPPVPKRPLGPPVILYWGDTPIRMRSDIERAGRTWEEFLDAMAEDEVDALSLPQFSRSMIGRGGDAVRKLTPAHERAAVMDDFWTRVRVAMEREQKLGLGGSKDSRDAALKAAQDVQAKVTGSLISRLFGRAA